MFARAAKLAAESDNLRLMKLFAETLATIVNGELTSCSQRAGNQPRELHKTHLRQDASLLR